MDDPGDDARLLKISNIGPWTLQVLGLSGRGEPDCAAITAAIEACTNTKCRVSLGKPSPVMVEAALGGTGIELSRCVMVGDRLMTDIKMAVDAGMASALVLTGESTVEDVLAQPESERPTYILDRVDQLLP